MQTTKVSYMQKMSEVLGQCQEGGCEKTECILSDLKELMQNKHGDIILLCSVIVAFGMLLAASAAS